MDKHTARRTSDKNEALQNAWNQADTLKAENAALREQLSEARKELKKFEALKKVTMILVDGLERIPALRSSPQERAAYQELFKIVQDIL